MPQCGNGAFYRVHPERLESARIEVRDVWFTDVVPPGGGETDALLEVGPRGARWSRRATVRAGDAPAPEDGELASKPGLERAVDLLRRLESAGALGLPPTVEPRPLEGILMEGHALSLTLEVFGPAGRWRYATMLPATALYHPAFAAAAKAVTALLDSMNGGG